MHRSYVTARHAQKRVFTALAARIA
jgi:hypothetical protein